MARAIKYTQEVLAPVVARNTSYAGVLRDFGLKQTGGSQSNMIYWVKKYKLPTDHFTGCGWLRGKRGSGHNQMLTADQILIRIKPGSRPRVAHLLRRALIESGVAYACSECGVSSWLNKPLVLEVDHQDGDRLNNSKKNLRFLCPNCHSQTDNYGSKNKPR